MLFFLQDLLSRTHNRLHRQLGLPVSVQALLLLCNPYISWAAIAEAGQTLPGAFHPFPNRSERGELWHEKDYALRQGVAGENTFNVLLYGSFRKRGNIDSAHGPCGSVFSLSLKTRSRFLWKMSQSKLPFLSCSNTNLHLNWFLELWNYLKVIKSSDSLCGLFSNSQDLPSR